MLKLGVYKFEQLRNGKDTTIFGRMKKVDLSLLKDAYSAEEPDRTKYYERIMLDQMDDRGAYKRTYRSRFDKFDAAVLDILNERFAARNSELRIHDSAISNG